MNNNSIQFSTNEDDSENRLDVTLSKHINHLTRSHLKKIIESKNVKINGIIVTSPSRKIKKNDNISVNLTVSLPTKIKPVNIKLDIIYEDKDLIVINKPSGMVVHPGAGNSDGTLLNALLYHYPSIAEVPRAGIVHRLDKETSGLMVVAKTVPAQTHLVMSLQARQMTREYDPIRITMDERISRKQEQIMAMTPEIEDYVVSAVNGESIED